MPEEIQGINSKYNAEVIQNVLSGTYNEPCTNIVALNAGAGIYVGGATQTLRDGVFMAKEIIKSGKALQRLNKGSNGQLSSLSAQNFSCNFSDSFFAFASMSTQ